MRSPKRAGVWICSGEEENCGVSTVWGLCFARQYAAENKGGFAMLCIRRKVWAGQRQALLHAKEQSERKRV